MEATYSLSWLYLRTNSSGPARHWQLRTETPAALQGSQPQYKTSANRAQLLLAAGDALHQDGARELTALAVQLIKMIMEVQQGGAFSMKGGMAPRSRELRCNLLDVVLSPATSQSTLC